MRPSTKVAVVVLTVAAAVTGCGERSPSAAPTVTVTAAPSANSGGTATPQPPGTGAPAATERSTSGPRTVTALPTTGRATRVTTASGKTTCNIYAEKVECQSGEFGRTYRAKTGEPASGFVYRGGALEWYYGNMAVTAPATGLRYGSSYSAFGWTVEASSSATVFTRDGHGVRVDVADTTTF